MSKSFLDFNFEDFITTNLNNNLDISEPSYVQEKTIPLILEGQNLIGKAKTGTGKTLAYLLPMLQNIDPTQRSLQTLVLAPSKELALQIYTVAQKVTDNTDIRVLPIVEGMDFDRQLDKLKDKPHLIIATPGRFLHILGLKKLKVHKIQIVALDEVDQMLEEGQVDKILALFKSLPREKQVLSFSATISKGSEELLYKLMNKPTFVNLDSIKPIPSKIMHTYLVSTDPVKNDTLVNVLKSVKPAKSIVFINKNESVDRFVQSLHRQGFNVGGIQTRTRNQDRQNTLSSFQKGKIKILVTTDLFTRGMDFQNVTHIFNMDLPRNDIDYLHRAGRTGRMNKDGLVINVVRDREKFIMYKMMKKLNIDVQPIALLDNELVDVNKIVKRRKK